MRRTLIFQKAKWQLRTTFINIQYLYIVRMECVNWL
jgi:hypothetical protein